jgi:hypothetical protein
LEDLGIDERITKKGIFRKCNGGRGMDWSDMGQNRERRGALVNVALDL